MTLFNRVSSVPDLIDPETPILASRFRLLLGVVGFGLLLSQVAFANWHDWPSLATLFAAALIAELVLSTQLDARQFISVTSPFASITLLSYGPATAALLVASALLGSLLVRMALRQLPASPSLLGLSVGQMACAAVGAGLITSWSTATPLDQAPSAWIVPLLIYLLSYMIITLVLESIAITLHHGLRDLWVHWWAGSSRWTLISFAGSAPLALATEVLAVEIGLLPTIGVVFVALTALAYMLRLTLRFGQINRELTVLNRISAELAGTLELGALFGIVYQRVGELMPTDAFYIALVNQEQASVEMTYLIDAGVEVAPRSLPLGSGLVGHVLTTGKPLWLNELLPHSPLGPHFGRLDRSSRSVMIAPLQAGTTTLGAISAQSYRPQAFNPRQHDLLIAIARIAALAINNAQLYQREHNLLREREEFVSLVVHELKNPIAAILGYQQIAVRRARLDDSAVQRPLAVIAEQASRMSQLINDLLDLSRADVGQLAINRQWVDLRALVEQAVEHFQTIAPAHQFKLRVVDHISVTQGDPLRLEQVLHNLLGNAVKYSLEGGIISTTIETVACGEYEWPRQTTVPEPSYGWIKITIEDHGLGIPVDQVPHIFTRFYRASNHRQRAIAGAGLGLSVCAELVRAHNGLIWAESVLDTGTTMHLVLPIDEVLREE